MVRADLQERLGRGRGVPAGVVATVGGGGGQPQVLGHPVLGGADGEGRHPGALDGVELVAEVAHEAGADGDVHPGGGEAAGQYTR